ASKRESTKSRKNNRSRVCTLLFSSDVMDVKGKCTRTNTFSLSQLQEQCRKLHKQIDLVDEERYDMEVKVAKSNKEVDDLKLKIQDLNGRFKKPVLKKVRMSADAMLSALLASLKQVKKEVKDEVANGRLEEKNRKQTDMGGRKKMFETEA
uniref:Troponin I2, fast skeletal type n=1 Tax=Oreochromis aureus TaxID=47969 RepID=A0A668VIL9_OREAU